jgi:HEAT repeat protein
MLAARLGRYDVLAWRGAEPPAGVPAEAVSPARDRAALLAALAEPDRELRRAAVAGFLAAAQDAAGVARLADAWAADEASRLLLVRNLGESGDERSLPFLVTVVASPRRRLRVEAAGALNLLALRAGAERHLLGGDGGRLAAAVERMARELSPAALRAWLGDPELRERAGVFAAGALAAAGDRASVPVLEAMLQEERRPYLRVAAAEALAVLGRPQRLCDLVDTLAIPLHEVQDVVPSALLDAAGTHPRALARCLGHGLAHPVALVRETSAWIAGAARVDSLAPALRRALDDRSRDVRIAAAWAAGCLRDDAARPALAALAGDGDAELAAFATEAVSRIDGRAS